MYFWVYDFSIVKLVNSLVNFLIFDGFLDFVQYEALAWLCGGLSCFAGLGFLAVWNDKASKIPFVSLKTLI